MVKYMEEVKTLGYSDKPPYQKLRTILQSALTSLGASADNKLDFSMTTNGVSSPKAKVRTRLSALLSLMFKVVVFTVAVSSSSQFKTCHVPNSQAIPFSSVSFQKEPIST